VGRRLDPVDVEALVEHRVEHGEYQPQLPRLGSRHHGVDRDVAHGRFVAARVHEPDHVVRMLARSGQHRLDALGRGKDDGEPVRVSRYEGFVRRRFARKFQHRSSLYARPPGPRASDVLRQLFLVERPVAVELEPLAIDRRDQRELGFGEFSRGVPLERIEVEFDRFGNAGDDD
jgi:hypothetical protein